VKRLFARAGLSGFAALWVGVIAATPAHADEGWTITGFHSDIKIAADSSLLVTEDIRADFGNLQKHGIFRTIPVQYRFDSTHDRYFALSVKSVTDGTRPVTYTDRIESGNKVIKIGDPNRTVSGANRYVITYSVAGAMDAFNDHDELFWNVDGALWPVSKQLVTATVTVPSGAFQKAACYQGTTGSRNSCMYSKVGNEVTFSSSGPLQPGDQLSAVTGLNKGAINVPGPLLTGRERHFPEDGFDVNAFTIGVSALILLAGLLFVAGNWWVHGRDRAYLTQYYLTNDPSQHAAPLFRREPVVVEFEAPQKLRPAQLGLILDELADTKDVTATIVDLAVRGNLTISEVQGEKDWLFTKKDADTTALVPYEKTILDGLFDSRTQVRLSELKYKFHDTLRRAEGEVISDAMSRRFFTSRPDVARTGWGCAGLAGIVVGCLLTYWWGANFGWGFAGLAVLVVSMVAFTISRFMPQRTAAGREAMQHALGFRLYMTTAEKYRQQFAEKAQIFTQLLPYAIVFGCVTLWAKAFEGIDISASNNWYVGNQPFQAGLLAGSLQSMDSSISSTISATQPSSSGGSSGFSGGSGGGGGGGGGGSW
jgi:hypothetical protein